MNMYSCFLLFERTKYTVDRGYAHVLEHYLILRVRKKLGIKVFGETSGIYMLFWWTSSRNEVDRICSFIENEIREERFIDLDTLKDAAGEVSYEIDCRKSDVEKYITLCLKVNGFFSGSPLGLELINLEKFKGLSFNKVLYLDKRCFYVFDRLGNLIKCKKENIFENLNHDSGNFGNMVFTSDSIKDIRIFIKSRNIFSAETEVYLLANHLVKIMLSNLIEDIITSLIPTRDCGQGRIILYNKLFLYTTISTKKKVENERAKNYFIKAIENKDSFFSKGVNAYQAVRTWILNEAISNEHCLITTDDLRREVIYNSIYGESYLCNNHEILINMLSLLSEEKFLEYIGLFFSKC